MTKLIKKIAVFLAPFYIYAAAAAIIDPYDYFGKNTIIDEALKSKRSAKINRPLWAMTNYKNHPTPNIFIGESSMVSFAAVYMEGTSDTQWSNLAAEEQTLPESIDMFWFAAKRSRLERVVFGADFVYYNKYAYTTNRIPGLENTLGNPFLYLIDSSVPKSMWYLIKGVFRPGAFDYGKVTMSKEAFWQQVLSVTRRRAFTKYEYPVELYAELKKIADYCGKNNIRLSFLILPLHDDVRRMVGEFRLESEEQRFERDLAAIAPTYTFNYHSDFTTDKNNFADPLHPAPFTYRSLVDDFFGGTPRYLRRLPATNKADNHA